MISNAAWGRHSIGIIVELNVNAHCFPRSHVAPRLLASGKVLKGTAVYGGNASTVLALSTA
jgi:hypothetical protein